MGDAARPQARQRPRAARDQFRKIYSRIRIYLTSEDGDMFVVRAGRRFELLATNKLGEVTMATPAVAGPMLIVRTRSDVIGLREGGRASR